MERRPLPWDAGRSASPPPANSSEASLMLDLFTRLRQRSLFFAAHFRILQVHSLQRIHHSVRDHKSCEPFVIRWHNVPGSARTRRVPNHILVGFLIRVPELALLDVR